MDRVLSVSLGEVVLKGLNRKYFEDKLIKNIRRASIYPFTKSRGKFISKDLKATKR